MTSGLCAFFRAMTSNPLHCVGAKTRKLKRPRIWLRVTLRSAESLLNYLNGKDGSGGRPDYKNLSATLVAASTLTHFLPERSSVKFDSEEGVGITICHCD